MLHESTRPPEFNDGEFGDLWYDATTRILYGPKGGNPQVVNSIYCPSFELDDGSGSGRPAGWGCYQNQGTADLVRSPEAARRGKYGGKITVTTPISDFGPVTNGTPPGPYGGGAYNVPIPPGLWLSCTGYARAAAVPRRQYMIVAFFSDAAHITSVSGSPVISKAGEFSQVPVFWTQAPAGTTYANVYVVFQAVDGSKLPVGEVHHVDCVCASVNYGQIPDLEYFDGDMPGFKWLGTPHLSQSVGIGWELQEENPTRLDLYVPTAVPTGESFADQLVQRFEPWLTPHLEEYLRAVASMFEEVELYAFDTDDAEGWEILFDPDLAPEKALPYLAQYWGEELPVGITEAGAREWIKDAAHQRRGTPESVFLAAQRRLTGNKLVSMFERYNGEVDKLRIVTYAAQTPDPAGTQADILSELPADVILQYDVLAGQTWDNVKAGYASWGAVPPKTWSEVSSTLTGYEHFPGDDVIEEVRRQMGSLRGQLLSLVEAANLPARQERGLKSCIRTTTYDAQAKLESMLRGEAS